MRWFPSKGTEEGCMGEVTAGLDQPWVWAQWEGGEIGRNAMSEGPVPLATKIGWVPAVCQPWAVHWGLSSGQDGHSPCLMALTEVTSRGPVWQEQVVLLTSGPEPGREGWDGMQTLTCKRWDPLPSVKPEQLCAQHCLERGCHQGANPDIQSLPHLLHGTFSVSLSWLPWPAPLARLQAAAPRAPPPRHPHASICPVNGELPENSNVPVSSSALRPACGDFP